MPIYKGSTKLGTISKGNTKTIPIYQVPANTTAGGSTGQSPITLFGYPTANTTVPCGVGWPDDTPGKFLVKSLTGTIGVAGSSIVSTNPIDKSGADVAYNYAYSRTLGGYYFHFYQYDSGLLVNRLYVSPKQRIGDYLIMHVLPAEFVCNEAVTGGISTGYYPPDGSLAPYTSSVAFTGSPVKIFDYYYRKA